MIKPGDWYEGKKFNYIFVINKIRKKYLYATISRRDDLYIKVRPLKLFRQDAIYEYPILWTKAHPSKLSPKYRKLIDYIFTSNWIENI